jgi:hypothetical protein
MHLNALSILFITYTVPFQSIQQSHIIALCVFHEIWHLSHITEALCRIENIFIMVFLKNRKNNLKTKNLSVEILGMSQSQAPTV